MKIKRYGWVADLPDHRDHIYAAPMQVVTTLPPKADLTQQCPQVYDQGQLGYDDSQNYFIVRNSWGTGWGMKGYFTLPYAYFLDQNLSDDFWTIRLVS